jgi:hypothetical protein
LIGDLRCEINRHAQRNAQDIKQAQERMPPQIPQHVPPENTKILRCHSACDLGMGDGARYKNSVTPVFVLS